LLLGAVMTIPNVACRPAPRQPSLRNHATTQPAPSIPHDERYFSQTGYRIDNDQIWNFFQSYGMVQTFGYPTSRVFTFLGCPVQFFQRQVIQNCAGAGAALINILDPGIFPYTKVNGSTFPAPDPAMKANTPPVSSPTYSTDIVTFVNANVPNTFNGQPVNFLDYFNNQGGLWMCKPNQVPGTDYTFAFVPG
jgi:hypothetical protein